MNKEWFANVQNKFNNKNKKQMKIVHASLFSGFGAPDIAAQSLGWTNAFHCEINDFCNTILNYWFPLSICYKDVTKTDFRKWRGKIHVLTGGFPCQPFSVAGKRQGANDDRYLWPEMLRAIREIQPDWVVGENVAGILSMVQPGEEIKMGSQSTLFGEDNNQTELRQEFVIETICKDLEREGYSVQPVIIPACSVGAPHRRDRIWFIANRTGGIGCERSESPYRSFSHSLGDGCLPSGQGVETEEYGRQELCESGSGRDQTQRIDGLSGLQESTSHSGCFGLHHGVHQGCELFGEDVADGQYTKDVTEREQLELGSFESDRPSVHADRKQLEGRIDKKEPPISILESMRTDTCNLRDWKDFPSQPPICRGDDGLPFDVDCLTIPLSRWKQESIKGYGNAIVPRVILQIFLAIEKSYEQ